MLSTRKVFLGSLIAGALLAAGLAQAASIHVEDHSFEQATGSLSNGFLGIGAETSKTIGGWHYQRSSLLGLLPPNTGSYSSAHATDGQNIASVHTTAAIAGQVIISQTLDGQYFQPNTAYTLQVDVRDGGLLSLVDSGPKIALTAGDDIVASSANPSLLTILNCTDHFDTWSLTFITGQVVPAGLIGIELSVKTLVGVATTVSFDNVRLDATAIPSPAALTSGLGCLMLLILRRRTGASPIALPGEQGV